LIRRAVLGSNIHIDVSDRGLTLLLSRLLGAFPEDEDARGDSEAWFRIRGSADCFAVAEGTRTLLDGGSAGEVTLALLTRINELVIDRYRGLAVHSGAVAIRDRVIAFPGPTGAGKSTFTVASVRTGFTYVSDEALCMRWADGVIDGYPRAIHLDTNALDLLGIKRPDAFESCPEAAIGPSEIGADLAADSLRLAEVVLLRRKPGPPAITPTARSQNLAELLRLSFNHYKAPAAALALLTGQVQRTRSWILNYSDPIEAAWLLKATFT
jgi:hypothetical protein